MASLPLPPASNLITLPQHVEFLSDRWLDEARAFFREALPLRREMLAGKAFTVSERFTDAPPHLKFPRDAAAWSLAYRRPGRHHQPHVQRKRRRGGRGRLPGRPLDSRNTSASWCPAAPELRCGAMTRHMYGKDAVHIKSAIADEQTSDPPRPAARPPGPPHRRKPRSGAPRPPPGPDRQDPRDGGERLRRHRARHLATDFADEDARGDQALGPAAAGRLDESGCSTRAASSSGCTLNPMADDPDRRLARPRRPVLASMAADHPRAGQGH